MSKRTSWQRIPIVQVRTPKHAAVPELGVWYSSTGYQILPVISWESRQGHSWPVVERWQVVRKLARVGRDGAILRHVRFSGSVRQGKRYARDDHRTRRAKQAGGARALDPGRD